MLGRIHSIFLIAVIFICPLLCSRGAGGERAVGGSCGGGCCHSHDVPVPTGERPCPPQHPGKSRCCVCGGAVMVEAVQLLSLDTSVWVPFCPLPLLSLPEQGIEVNRFGLEPWPDDGMNAGRALCYLYGTLLC